MPASSLLSMARRACIKNIRSITDVGDASYELLRPILHKVENPEQLRQLEIASPQICGEDAELWLQFLERDVPNYKTKPHEPTDPQKWYRCYQKLVRESRNEIDKDAALLKATIDGIKDEKAKHKLKRVDLGFVELPKGMQRDAPIIQLRNKIRFIDRGTQHGPIPSQRQVKINRGELDPNAPRRIPEPKGKLAQFRKEAKAMGHFQHQMPKKPTGIITAREMALKQKPTAATISQAPRGLVEEHRAASIPKPIDPTTRTAPAFATIKRRRSTEHGDGELPSTSSNEEREKRLRAFTNPSSAPRTGPIIRPPRSRTLTPTSSSPATTPPSGQSKPTLEARSAFGQISKRNIQVLNNRKTQEDAFDRSLRLGAGKRSELTRLGLSGGNSQSSVKKAVSSSLQCQITPSMSSSTKVQACGLTALGNHGLGSGTSSPSNNGTGITLMRKRRGPVDVFMPSNKRSKPS